MFSCFSPIVCPLPIPFHSIRLLSEHSPVIRLSGIRGTWLSLPTTGPPIWYWYVSPAIMWTMVVWENFQQIIRVLGSTSLLGNYCYLAKGELFWTHSLFTRFSNSGICHLGVNFFVFGPNLKTKIVLKSLYNFLMEGVISK